MQYADENRKPTYTTADGTHVKHGLPSGVWHRLKAGAPPESVSVPTVGPTDSILLEAEQVVHGARNDAYGDCVDDYTDVAALWSVVLGFPITPHQAALCMCAVKLRREAHKHGRDNLVDLCGYAHIAQRCAEAEGQKEAKT